MNRRPGFVQDFIEGCNFHRQMSPVAIVFSFVSLAIFFYIKDSTGKWRDFASHDWYAVSALLLSFVGLFCFEIRLKRADTGVLRFFLVFAIYFVAGYLLFLHVYR